MTDTFVYFDRIYHSDLIVIPSCVRLNKEIIHEFSKSIIARIVRQYHITSIGVDPAICNYVICYVKADKGSINSG